MKNIIVAFTVLALVFSLMYAVSCQPGEVKTGLLQGGVTIGPITPVEMPGQPPPVPPEVFSSRKVLVYDKSGKNLVKEVVINQIGQTANGFYAVALEAGTYVIDVTRTGAGGTAGLPKTINIVAGQTTMLDINIDTGIR